MISLLEGGRSSRRAKMQPFSGDESGLLFPPFLGDVLAP